MSEISNVVVILTDANSWLNNYVKRFEEVVKKAGYSLQWETEPQNIRGASFCFLLGYTKTLSNEFLQSTCEFLVVHESDLPHGRGWSPLTWQVLEGKTSIPVTLIEAKLPVDTGAILAQTYINLSGTELVDDLRNLQGQATINLVEKFLKNPFRLKENARLQQGESTWYPRRRPSDSKIDIDDTILNQINLLRVVDNDRYPAWFEYGGSKFVIKISKK
jgi:methionyl-tRNA formyltransferase